MNSTNWLDRTSRDRRKALFRESSPQNRGRRFVVGRGIWERKSLNNSSLRGHHPIGSPLPRPTRTSMCSAMDGL